MSEDWRQKARNMLEKKRKDSPENITPEKAKEEAKIRLAKFQAKFRCCVCGLRSAGPFSHSSNDGLGWQDRSGVDTTYTNWDIPSDLTKCNKCNEWTCSEHLESGICQTCAEKYG